MKALQHLELIDDEADLFGIRSITISFVTGFNWI